MAQETVTIGCSGCGHANPLGRVFCDKCGARLPSQLVTAADMARAGWINRTRNNLRRRLSLMLPTVLLAMLLLALWPASSPFDPEAELGAARRLQRTMSIFVEALDAGDPGVERIEQTLKQSEINGYLRHGFLRDSGTRRGSVLVLPDGVRARWQMVLFTLPLGPVEWRPMASIETIFRPEGTRLVPSRARLGHLPLPGPVGAPVHGLFLRALHGSQEWTVLQHLELVGLSRGEIRVALTSNGEPSASTPQ